MNRHTDNEGARSAAPRKDKKLVGKPSKRKSGRGKDDKMERMPGAGGSDLCGQLAVPEKTRPNTRQDSRGRLGAGP